MVARSTREIFEEFKIRLADRFPSWASESNWAIESEGGDEIWATIAVPGRRRHVLRFRVQSNWLEVHYDDKLPPGAAEQGFGFESHKADDAVDAVEAFMRDLVEERILVFRERLSGFWRLLRGQDCESLPGFITREKLLGRIRKNLHVVYSWKGSYDQGDMQDPYAFEQGHW